MKQSKIFHIKVEHGKPIEGKESQEQAKKIRDLLYLIVRSSRKILRQ